MSRTYLWILQLASGALLAVFLGIHLVMQHLDNILGFFGVPISEPTAWNSMLERASSGLWLAFYIVLLALSLYHGLNGLRGIILEMTPSARAERIVTAIILVMGLVALGLGIYVPADLFSG